MKGRRKERKMAKFDEKNFEKALSVLKTEIEIKKRQLQCDYECNFKARIYAECRALVFAYSLFTDPTYADDIDEIIKKYHLDEI